MSGVAEQVLEMDVILNVGLLVASSFLRFPLTPPIVHNDAQCLILFLPQLFKMTPSLLLLRSHVTLI